VSATRSHPPTLAPDVPDIWTRTVSKTVPAISPAPVELRTLGGLDSEVLSLSVGTLVDKVGVAASTAREWRRLKRIPAMWRRAVRALVLGDVGAIDARFEGWRIEDGKLHAPDRGEFGFTPADLHFLPFARRMIAKLEGDLRRAREQMRTALEAQQRAHDAKLNELQVPTQADWLTGEYRAAPVASSSIDSMLPTAEPEPHGYARYMQGAHNYALRAKDRAQ